jgi:glycosyltransferase involved in cell wall biosynthesis
MPAAFQYMNAFDCFVLSSIQEAFGRVLLEAMLAKLPVIATAVHGIPEVVADAGLLINPKNTNELRDAMQKIYLLTQAERHQQGEKAHQRVADCFSIPAFQKQFWHILQTI